MGVRLSLIILTLVGAVFFVADLLFASSLDLRILASALGIAIGTAIIGWRWLHSLTVIVAGSLAALGFLLMTFVELTPVKPFRAFFRNARPGMTKAAVLAILEEHFPAGGAYRRPVVYAGQEGRLLLTLDPRRSSYNSEVIDLYFESDSLVRSSYYID